MVSGERPRHLLTAQVAGGWLAAAGAFARTRWLAARLRTRRDIVAYQAQQLAALERDLARDIAFYAGMQAAAWPVIGKAVLTASFDRFNCGHVTADEVRAALAGSDVPTVRGYGVGQSTGTSGNRGYYVISDRERFVWLGTILAKTLPDALWRRHRVALALPGLSSLYRSATQGSRIALGFFDLGEGIDRWADRLVAFAPDTIVAPPRVLRALAERGQLTATTVFSGAEVLDPLDRRVIEAATGVTVREIYMATEGLFGVACRHGTLHLAEDAVRFEWEAVEGGLVTPIVTDFRRRAQAMVRYRMNDLLALDDAPCSCGSPYQAVARIGGRCDDMLQCAGRDGTLHPVTPDILRNAVVDADPRIDDFRIVQTGPCAITVSLPAALPSATEMAVGARLAAVAERLDILPWTVTFTRGIAPDPPGKLRRVRRAWRPDQSSTVVS